MFRCRSICWISLWLLLGQAGWLSTALGEFDERRWIDQFSHSPPTVFRNAVAEFASADLPRVTVTPAAAGTQTVRLPLPIPAGALAEGLELVAVHQGLSIDCGTRALTFHPGTPAWVRRAMVTFTFDFPSLEPVEFSFEKKFPEELPDGDELSVGPLTIAMDQDGITVQWDDGRNYRADVIAPEISENPLTRLEVIERNAQYLWARLLVADDRMPRILEVRADARGSVIFQVHVQRREPGDAYAPELGWHLKLPDPLPVLPIMNFAQGQEHSIECGAITVSFPIASLTRKGAVSTEEASLVYRRCQTGDETPFQSHAWRRAVMAIQPSGSAPLNPLLQPSHEIYVSDSDFNQIYESGLELDLTTWPSLQELRHFNRQCIVASSLRGDDYGNVTGGTPGTEPSVFGMNRLNHCPAIFENYFLCGDSDLRETAILWCENIHDLSIWWGDDDTFGGTRYNNAVANGEAEHEGDSRFMWRTNGGIHTFCTKGYDSFFYAWEETGDPRMSVALRHQTAYASKHVNVDRGEARNIGDVSDFVKLYRFTGQPAYLDQALRLWRQLERVLGDDGLFSQSGRPIVPVRPFIDNDGDGAEFPFAKPYILGYALSGCPSLLQVAPEEPGLREMLRSVARFMVDSIDPVGGWRYPAPESSSVIIGQGMEHAAQLARAAMALERALEHPASVQADPDFEQILDAVELVLQARLGSFTHCGQQLSGLAGWERSTGKLKPEDSLRDWYPNPNDRDRSKDYDLGAIGLGSIPPDGTVYFPEVLAFYLQHRPAERLSNRSEPLQKVLDRIAQTIARTITQTTERAVEQSGERGNPDIPVDYETGIRDLLPTFNSLRLQEMSFPGRWDPESEPFFEWRNAARQKLLSALGQPPPRADFAEELLAVEDRGTHTALKLALNVNAWQRIVGYLLVPKGEGPFPAIVALHDHGAHFSIGKEKVVRPFGVADARMQDAQQWVDQYYGGKWIADELASRGYVVFATDALFWGDRQQEQGSKYEDQQALAANLLQLGISWAGVILWDDLRSTEFLRSRREVIPTQIGIIGLSLGGFRAWNLAAATDTVQAAVAVCWLGDTLGLAQPGNNQTRGQSAYSMIQPYIRNQLDYPDVASIACPKPVLFQNGMQDSLFPVASVERAYQRLKEVWRAQGASQQLQTQLWPVGHQFSHDMQQSAFEFLDRWLKTGP
jgi:dienelactone hydrolase